MCVCECVFQSLLKTVSEVFDCERGFDVKDRIVGISLRQSKNIQTTLKSYGSVGLCGVQFAFPVS